MKDLVSVIIVNWNGKRWLEKCLDSLRVQTYKNFEVIFVDNASTDDSIELVERNYPEIIVVKSDKNRGFAGGNNLGLSYSAGEYIMLLNSDTWMQSNFLEELLFSFKRSEADVLGVTEIGYQEELRPSPYMMRIDPLGHAVTLAVDAQASQPFYISGACVFFKKKTYEESGGLDDDFFLYCEEVDWFWRLHLLNRKIFHDQKLFLHHAGGGSFGAGINYQTFLWRNQNTLQMLLKNYAWYNLLWVLPIYFIQNIFEIIVFLILLRPKIAWSYVEGWWFNLRHLKRTLRKRGWIQRSRIVGDREVMKKMYIGLGKAHHLLNFLKSEKI